MQTLLNIYTVRAKTIVISELSLFNKLEIITALELRQEATADDNPNGCQGPEGDLHVEVSSDNPHTQRKTSAE